MLIAVLVWDELDTSSIDRAAAIGTQVVEIRPRGNLAVAFILPLMGGWYDAYGAATAFRYVGVLPIILTVVFAALWLRDRSRGGYRAVQFSSTGDGAPDLVSKRG